jgi:hypothetical protein
MLKATQLTLDDFYFQIVQKRPQVLPGEAQFFSQTEGRGTGNLAFRGRRPDFILDIFLGHAYLWKKLSL